jgi:hypothetical protein
MKNSYLIILSLLAFSFLSLVACGEEETQGQLVAPVNPEEGASLVDRSFITGEPCEAPCWYNIQLAATTETEVKSVLAILPFIDPASIETNQDLYDPSAKMISFNCRYKTEQNCGFVGVSGLGLVTGMGHEIAYDLPLSEVINRYNSPEYIFYNAYYGSDDKCQLALYWPKKNIAVEIVQPKEAALCESLKAGESLDGNMQINWVYYAILDEDGGEGTRDWPGLAN